MMTDGASTKKIGLGYLNLEEPTKAKNNCIRVLGLGNVIVLEQNNISLVSSVHLEFQLRLKQEAAAEVILPAPFPQASCHGHLPPPTAFAPAGQYPPQQSAPV